MHALVQFYYINDLFMAGGWFAFYVLHGVLHG